MIQTIHKWWHSGDWRKLVKVLLAVGTLLLSTSTSSFLLHSQSLLIRHLVVWNLHVTKTEGSQIKRSAYAFESQASNISNKVLPPWWVILCTAESFTDHWPLPHWKPVVHTLLQPSQLWPSEVAVDTRGNLKRKALLQIERGMQSRFLFSSLHSHSLIS